MFHSRLMSINQLYCFKHTYIMLKMAILFLNLIYKCFSSLLFLQRYLNSLKDKTKGLILLWFLRQLMLVRYTYNKEFFLVNGKFLSQLLTFTSLIKFFCVSPDKKKNILAFKFLPFADTTTTGRRAIFTGVRKHRK